MEHAGRQHRVRAGRHRVGEVRDRPAPPLAITGTADARPASAIIWASKPAVVPSASIEFSRISPAPSSAARATHSIASIPVPVPAAVGGDLEAAGGTAAGTPGVDRHHDALRPEPRGGVGEQSGSRDRRGVHPHLVRAGAQQAVEVLDGAHAAADRQRDEDLGCRARHDVDHGLPVAGTGGDVQEHQLVGAGRGRTGRPVPPGRPASRRFRKLTPLTTRPSSTSRQGITRTATDIRQGYVA